VRCPRLNCDGKIRNAEAEPVETSPDVEDSLRERERDLVAALGWRISRLREAKGWSQTDLARRLGVSRGRLGNWERGGHAPPIVIQIALSRMLGVSFGELVAGEGPAERRQREVRVDAERHLEALRRLLCDTEEAAQKISRIALPGHEGPDA
jgi:transcriptional regulator with XRE-family HTH domain